MALHTSMQQADRRLDYMYYIGTYHICHRTLQTQTDNSCLESSRGH